MTAGRKRDAVLRLLRGEPLEIVARELEPKGEGTAVSSASGVPTCAAFMKTTRCTGSPGLSRSMISRM
jgi:hypothetical protein